MALSLTRRRRPAAAISVVSMIDVLMIMLIFFMVTSTYLDLDMVPAARKADEDAAQMPAAPSPASSLLLRIAPDGQAWLRGQALPPEALSATLRQELTARPDLQLVLLPSSGAKMQALVSVMDLATAAGAGRIRVMRLEAAP